MDAKLKHLEFIQSAINRMAEKSFLLKGWTVTLLAGIFALSNKDTDATYFLVTYIPTIIFWAMDSYYLLQERLYRALYDKVAKLDNNEVDFSMNTLQLDLQRKENTYWVSMFSKTELGFYLPLALISTGVVLLVSL